MGFDPRPYFRFNPSDDIGEPYQKDDLYLERNIDCTIDLGGGEPSVPVTLNFHVMETDRLDTSNFLVFTRKYKVWNREVCEGLPPGFMDRNPRLVDSLIMAGSRCDKASADFLWSLFVDLEITSYLEADVTVMNGRASIVADYFPKMWKAWKKRHEDRKLSLVEGIMEK
jgi:hypothetical protein